MSSSSEDDALHGIEHRLEAEDANFVRAFERPRVDARQRRARRVASLSIGVLIVLCVLMIVADRAAEAWLTGLLACVVIGWRYRGVARQRMRPPQR